VAPSFSGVSIVAIRPITVGTILCWMRINLSSIYTYEAEEADALRASATASEESDDADRTSGDDQRDGKTIQYE